MVGLSKWHWDNCAALNNEVQEQAVKLYNTGMYVRDIAKVMDIPKTVVHRAIQNYRERKIKEYDL